MNASFFNTLFAGLSRGRGIRTREASVESLLSLCDALISGRGEASGVNAATDILGGYRGLGSEEKEHFFSGLAHRFGPDPVALKRAARDYLEVESGEAAILLHQASEPRRQELLRRLNLAPGGTEALVRMREDLIQAARRERGLAAVDLDFQHLFSSWFNRGFLVMRRVDWETPAAILEKIIRYEAVHAINGWADLRRRVDAPDRRLYAFFHPALADDPLIFIEVALTRGIPDAIDPILTAERDVLDPEEATTAVFYSISNCQMGLRGISFGSFLIKHVVDELRREVSGLKTFVTLSPVPGFAKWLKRMRATNDPVLDEEARILVECLLPGWHEDERLREGAERILMPLAAHYLARATDRTGRSIDPVARFHLGNGARLERVDWMADTSERGLEQSHGIMVNYRYVLRDIERNHEAFANRGEIAATTQVLRQARAVPMRKAGGEDGSGTEVDREEEKA